MKEENNQNLMDVNPSVRRIVFHDSSPKISNAAFAGFCHALNQRRPFSSFDTKSKHFIADMH